MILRTSAAYLKKLAEGFPAVFLTGPRQSGKTTLGRSTFPDWPYRSLEDIQVREEAREDPRGFLARFAGAPGLILDEAQNVPDLLSELQGFLDDRRCGPVLLTGSQNFRLSQHISQTLAGRAAILELLPFSLAELRERPARTPKDLDTGWAPQPIQEASDLDAVLFTGLYPAIHDRGLDPRAWLNAYIRTYVERDVRTLTNVGDLGTFTRFLRLVAGRAGQILNSSSLGADAGVDHTTARRWLSVLEASYVIRLLPPHHQNFSKRLIKSPKVMFNDTGLLCALLGIRSSEDLSTHPLRGAIFESFVHAELTKLFLHNGEPAPLYFWRDQAGHEVDALIDLGSRLLPLEIKSGQRVPSDALKGLAWFAALSGQAGGTLVHGGSESYMRSGYALQSWAGVTSLCAQEMAR